MFHRQYGSSGVDDVADEKTGRVGFAVIDDGEVCCILGSHRKLFGVVDDSIVIGDGFRGRVKNFDGGEELTIF